MGGKKIAMLGLIAGFALTLAIASNNRPATSVAPVPQAQQTSSSAQLVAKKVSIGIKGNSSSESAAPRKPAAAPSTNAQAPLYTVRLQIVEPDGVSNFEVNLNQGDDLCANLVEAKAECKIRSLLIDDSYLATFGSRYVREINGYSNNWTVKGNETRPEGCSLYKPKAGDYIEWKFGQ